jgi:hypothetical protein
MGQRTKSGRRLGVTPLSRRRRARTGVRTARPVGEQPEQGLFLGETWRLHPGICAFTSELFYESRLTAIPGLERQVIRSGGRTQGSGLRYMPVVHQGNQNSSPEEGEAIQKMVAEILGAGTTCVDRHGIERTVTLEDILIVAPYNAQIFAPQGSDRGIDLRQEVATDEIREADRSRHSGPPLPGECRMH